MAISINFPDKILPGVWHSYTITSDEGPPEGEVLLEGKPVDRRIIPMRAPKWKVTFKVPGDCAGKTLVLRFKNGAAQVEESKVIEGG
jgi:hypothetical protein